MGIFFNVLQLLKDLRSNLSLVQHSVPADDTSAFNLLLIHITELHQIHQQFVSEVDDTNYDAVKIASAFHKLVSSLQEYFKCLLWAYKGLMLCVLNIVIFN